MHRRDLLIVAAAMPWPAWADNEQDIATRLAAGGAVIAFRHALAPGVYDPPGFRLGECGTQRNLDDVGRAQAQRIGEWFTRRGLTPAAVRSSPWCRCLDTARLAFGRADSWAALGSPRVGTEETNQASLSELRRALAAATAQRGRFEVWVTHQFVLSSFAGNSLASGEGLLLTAAADGNPQVVGRLVI